MLTHRSYVFLAPTHQCNLYNGTPYTCCKGIPFIKTWQSQDHLIFLLRILKAANMVFTLKPVPVVPHLFPPSALQRQLAIRTTSMGSSSSHVCCCLLQASRSRQSDSFPGCWPAAAKGACLVAPSGSYAGKKIIWWDIMVRYAAENFVCKMAALLLSPNVWL